MYIGFCGRAYGHRYAIEIRYTISHLTLKTIDRANNASIGPLNQYRNLFQGAMSAFAGVPPSGLKFLPTSSNSSDDLPPLVDPSRSHSFCNHHQLIRKVLEYVVAVSSDDEAIMEERNQLISDIQDHLDYLNRTVKYEWLRQQATDSLDMAAAVQSSIPILVKSGIFSSSLLCTLAEIDHSSLIRCIRLVGLCRLPTAGERHRG